MKKAILISLLCILPLLPLQARRLEGRVHCGARLLAGVTVTDGERFAVTGPMGTFRLESARPDGYVSVVVPEGFSASGLDSFTQMSEGRRWFDFDLPTAPASESGNVFAMDFGLAAASVAPEEDPFREKVLPMLRDEALRSRISGRTIGFVFGSPGAGIRRSLEDMKINLYHVASPSGNEQTPRNYAFFDGAFLMVVTDSPSFLAGLLKYVDTSVPLMVMLGSPLYSLADGGAAFLEAVKGRRADFISAFGPGRHNSNFTPDVMEHVIPSLSGAENNTSPDGSPAGFAIFSREGNSLKWRTCNVDDAPDYKVEAPGANPLRPNDIILRAWDYDKAWSVTWEQDGEPMGRMNLIGPGLLAATPGRYAACAQIRIVPRSGPGTTVSIDLGENPESAESFQARAITGEVLFEKVMEAVEGGVQNLMFTLQLTSSGKVILCRDSYARFSDEPGGVHPAALVRKVEALATEKGLSPRRYIFCIHSGSGSGEGKVWPKFQDFAEACLAELAPLDLGERLVIGSFDDRLLNYMNSVHPETELMYFVDGESGEYADFMALLDFKPRWAAVQYEVFSAGMAEAFRREGIRTAVWDVTSSEFAAKARENGADALIRQNDYAY